MRDACSAQALQEKLINHKLDLILSNFLPERQQQILFRIKPIAEQQLSIALLSSVVVQDESRNGTLQASCKVPDWYEHFYAISLENNMRRQLCVIC